MNKTGKAAFLVALVSLGLTSARAWPQDGAKSLAGTWKLTGWLLRVVGETKDKEPFGPNPKGRLVITPDGYWIVIITAADRRPAKAPEDKVALFDSVLAYSGKYAVDGDKVTVRVDMSANEVFTGPSQVQTRFFTLDGDKLTVRTPEIASAALPGKKIVGTNIFEREH
ncbi:MAG TPA: lipocalin-like domain-containing protein [Casimicrobiaceae bacterium]